MAEIDNLGEGAENLGDSIGNLKDVLSELAVQLNKSANLTNDLAQNLQNAAEAGEDVTDAQEDTNKAQEKSVKTLDEIIKKNKGLNSLLNIGKGAALAFVTQLGNADKTTTQLGRGLNLSKTEAVELAKGFAATARDTQDITINSQRLIKANMELNKQLGTANRFSSSTLVTFSKLTEVVGISAESAGNLAFEAERSGKNFRAIEEDVLGASYGLQQQSGVALNLKGVLESTGKVTGTIRANLGANPVAIAKAVTQAKLLGTELEVLSAAGRTLLDFEQSIEKELEAELLTGKQLNLEKARSAALAGDENTLMEELSKNFGSHTDFMKMNVLQREKLAAAVGMEAGAMADMLFKQETMNTNAEELRAQGKEELANKLEQLDTQDKIQAAQEQLQATLADISLAVMPLVQGFGNIVQSLAESKNLVIALTSLFIGLAAAQKTLAILSMLQATGVIFAENAKAGPIIGTIAAIAGVAALAAAATAAYTYVEDGIAPPGGGPFTITDKFGATAVTAAGDGIAVSPNISKGPAQTQPIVIQNNWDAFQASNGNGRRGLGGTQSLQASPTFA